MGSSQILTNHLISGEIISLIESSKDYCFLVTPYYKPWPILTRTLEKAAALEKKIIFIFRSDILKEDSKKASTKDSIKILLPELNAFGFDIHFIDRLHTKLYLNEKTVILTSMNLYDSSKENNYEVGYKIKSVYEAKLFKEEVIEKDILALKSKLTIPGRYAAELERIEKAKLENEKKVQENRLTRKVSINRISETRNSYSKTNQGHCIRCNTRIVLDPNRPYCDRCYSDWAHNSLYDLQENNCHICGYSAPSSMNKSLCYSCYNKYQKMMQARF